MNYQPQHYSLAQLLAGRLFSIPDYQRAYRWEQKHRDALFSDIESSWNGGQSKHHFMATVVGLSTGECVNIIGEEFEHFEIVDGQQRLTTLILLLKAIAKTLDRSDKEESDYAEKLDRLLIKKDDASLVLLQTNHDTSGHFAKYIQSGSYSTPRSADTLADRQLLNAMSDCEAFAKKWQQTDGCSLTDLVTHLNNRLSFLFHQIGDEGLVYSVFEVLNSRGLEVSWFDRLKSALMSIVFETGGDKKALIQQIHDVWSEIYRTIGTRRGADVETLRFAATLRSNTSLSRVLGEEDSVSVLHDQSEGQASKAIETAEWLKDVSKAVVELRGNRRLSAVTRIAQARLVAVAVNLRSDLVDDERDEILRSWENVTFRIYGLYGKDARTAVGAYVRLAWRIWRENIPAVTISRELVKIGRSYPGDKAAQEIKKKDCYTGWQTELRYFFHRYEEHLAGPAGLNDRQWNKIWSARADDSIEHILPQKSNKEHMHWIGNLMILRPKLNSKLQDRGPKKKAKWYRKTGLLMANDVADRIDEAGKWRRSQIMERERELLDWASQEWAD